MNKILNSIIWLILLIPAVYLAVVWQKIPAIVPLHGDLKGNIDRYGNKNELIIMTVILTLIAAAVYLIVSNIYRIDPKKYAVENKSRMKKMAFAIAVFITGVQLMLLYDTIHGNLNFNMRFLFAGMGLLFCILGNYFHNIKPNYFAGLRLPWTLENEDNWRKTHLLAGKIWFAGGLIMAIVCLFSPLIVSVITTFTLITVMIFIPCVYSYRLYKKQKTLNSKSL